MSELTISVSSLTLARLTISARELNRAVEDLAGLHIDKSAAEYFRYRADDPADRPAPASKGRAA